jgi:hypothetical protein
MVHDIVALKGEAEFGMVNTKLNVSMKKCIETCSLFILIQGLSLFCAA